MPIKNRQQFLLIAAVVALGLLGANELVWPAIKKYWTSRTQQIAQLRKQIEEGNKLVLRKESLLRRWDTMRKTSLPPSPTLTEQQVFQAFDSWAQDSRLSINSITPRWQRDEDDNYMTYQCRVEGSGNLETLTRFLYNVEKDPMAIKVDMLEIAARDKEGVQLTMGIQISFLILTLQDKKQP